jgi:hypothetical protein
MLGASMPKAPVDENGEASFGENEIRFAEDWHLATPAGNGVFPEKHDKAEFRRLISATFDAGHYF